MRNGTLSVQNPDGSWSPVEGVTALQLGHEAPQPASPGRITSAGHRLMSWLGKLAPRQRTVLGLTRPAPAPYRPNAQARARARRQHRRMVTASRRANR